MILCLTHSNDFYTIDIVQAHLTKLGFPSFRLNTDEFAIGYEMNYSKYHNFENYELKGFSNTIKSSDIHAVWYRKLWNFKTPQDLDPDYKATFVKEYQTYLQIFLNTLKHIPWMNDMQADHAVGGDKMHQLHKAYSFGLNIPRTLVSNSANIIRDFYKSCNAEVVMKLHGALSKSMKGDTTFFPTTKLVESDLNQLDTLVYCPMIFQEYIRKAYELRIAYVDGLVFAGKISSDNEKVDWRIASGKSFKWDHYELPSSITTKIHKMMTSLGLHFGAIDMIKNTDGHYIFLEVNPQGEWGMLQKYLNYPIGEAIAEMLTKRIKSK
jgi:glutathione synthase/RimK-type ligase-like ATP-grasp enzyme